MNIALLRTSAVILSMAALAAPVSAQDKRPPAEPPANPTASVPPLTGNNPAAIDTKLIAAVPVGRAKLYVAAAIDSRRYRRLRVLYLRGEDGYNPRVSDVRVTLYLKDGRRLEPPLEDPDEKADFMNGLMNHNETIYCVLYSLKNIPLETLSAVQVVFRGKRSERAPFHAP